MTLLLKYKEIVTGKRTVMMNDTVSMNEVVGSHADIVSAEPLDVRLTAGPLGQGVLVTGPCASQIRYVCSRCLVEYERPLAFTLSEQFQSAVSESEADNDVRLADGDVVDLEPVVVEAAQLEIPHIPLCSETCQGLCPSCGQNLNERVCGCRVERIDPRLAGLQNFFSNEE